MWRNTDVVEFVEWLRAHNAQHDPQDKADKRNAGEAVPQK
jgi:erythromycin esterase-like protein